MAALELGSDQHSWAWSIVEAVGQVADRDVRWNGLVVVRDDGFIPSPDAGVSGLHALKSPLFMPARHADTVAEAYGQKPATGKLAPAKAQERWAALVEATGQMTSQVVGLTAPLPDLTDSKAYPEAAFNAGLSDVWTTPARLAAVWQLSESAELMLFDDVPEPVFSYAGTEPAASAARDVIAEITRLQGREATASDFSVISDELIQLPPDRRWDAVIEMAGAVHGIRSDVSRYRLAEDLRNNFLAAVEQGNPGSGTPASAVARAVRATTAEPITRTAVDARLAMLTNDAALSPASDALSSTSGRTPGSDGASAQPLRPGDHGVRRNPRSGRDRGGRH